MKRVLAIVVVIILLALNCGKDKNPFLLFTGNNQDQTSQNLNNYNDSSSQNDNSSSDNSPQMQNQDEYGNLENPFQTILNVNVHITVSDPDGPVQGAIISITDPSNNNANLFQSATNASGVVTGIFQVSTSVQSVNLTVTIAQLILSYEVPVSKLGQFLIRIDRNISLNNDVNNQNIVDSDNDGTPDENDAYPNDPTRATKIVFPSTGTATIAFEDLYPVPGDADFNDVVLQVYNEEDLNTQGKVVRIRGTYKFLARGAGYTHVVAIKLPGSGTVKQKVYNGSNVLITNINTHVDSLNIVPVFLKDALFFAYPVYTSSSTYRSHEICPNNTVQNLPYVQCYSSELEIIFDVPQEKTKYTSAPYDLHIYVINTSKEIHLPNYVYDANGRDIYLDNDGFPWVLIVPLKWNWPLWAANIYYGYPCFDNWYLSQGNNFRDWYLRVDSNSLNYLYIYHNDINYLNTEGCR